MVEGWRAEGIDRDRLEVWVVGYPSSTGDLESFCGGTDVSCFMDTTGVFTLYGANKDEFFVIDPYGFIRYHVNLNSRPLGGSHSAEIDAIVRSLLP